MATHVSTQGVKMHTVTKETVPLWLAVAITVVVSLPFGLMLDRFLPANLPLWVAFIVWAEYFALGAKPNALLVMVPSFIAGAIGTAASLFATLLLDEYTPLDFNWSMAVSLFVFVGAMVYLMNLVPTLSKGSLAYFNGISMVLAVYFTSSYPAVDNSYWGPWMALLWVGLAGLLGSVLGWFNVAITFSHEVEEPES